MSTYQDQLGLAARAARVVGPVIYTWFGVRNKRPPVAATRMMDAGDRRDYLLSSLQRRLYENFYLPGSAQPGDLTWRAAAAHGRTGFVEALSAANRGHGFGEDGWVLQGRSRDDLLLSMNDLSITADRDGVAGGQPDLQIGDHVTLRRPKESLAMSPGFYMAHGDRDLTFDAPVVRVYWNLTPQGALVAMEQLTSGLNDLQLPFRLKAVNDPAAYGHGDALVLYLRRADYGEALAFLSRTARAVAREANDAVPAFTKRIARGVAIAEDPAPGASFGAERCLLVAEGLVEAYERGERDVTGRLRCVAEMFTEAAISLDAPYLNPGSGDIYEVIEAKEQAPRKQRRSHAGDDVSEAVGRIGAWLCREAIWHEDRCTWMGEPPDSHAGRRLQSLDGDLYAGTSGIALFLARLAARSGDATARDHALGAVHHALTRVDRLRSADRNGLYDGSIGVAVAVAEVGLLLGDSELSERARSVARETAAALAADSAEDDLLGGRAGVIAGLLRLSEVLGEASVLEPVSRLSWELVTRAAARRGGVAWRSRRLEREQPLTGVSHGAAGIGLALVEAFAATGEAAFRDVAEAAFAYEQAWFNAEAGNWRDLRGVTRPGPRDLLACATDWCHGAPGIAVSRLEAHRVLGDEGLKQEAETGLETTLRRVWESLDGGLGATELCLCHGPLSCAEVLTLGARYFGNSRYREVALAFGSTLASWVKLEDAGAWQDAWQPGLMTGAAGAGYFLLRLLDPEIPSLLMPGVGTKSVVAGA